MELSKELIQDILDYNLLPNWLKNENMENILTELKMSECFYKDDGVIVIKPPIGWTWQIKKNY